MAGNSPIILLDAYYEIQASASVTNAAVSGGAVKTVAVAIAGSSAEKYPELDFMLEISGGGIPVLNSTVILIRRPATTGKQAPIPDSGYLHEQVGAFLLKNTVDSTYFFSGVKNTDPEDEYYIYNKNSGTLTMKLSVRGSGFDLI